MTTIAENSPAPSGGDNTADTGTRVSDPVGGGINRLQAFDGLFLRAEHLKQIQEYAEALSYAAGQAAGYGVVYGFDVSVPDPVKGDQLLVGLGLAISPQGRPLKSGSTATVSLGGLVAPPDGYWVVDVIAGPAEYGDEAVYGLVCDDPCAGGSSRRPFVAEGIRVRLTPATEPGLDGFDNPDQRRGWLASRLFERERQAGGPWLTPATTGGSVPLLSSRSWGSGAPPPAGESVPIAVLLRNSSKWEVDAWAVRREIGDPSPKRVWQWRLGMRPWQVFVAQVLHFQDLLKARHSPPGGLSTEMLRRHVEEELDYAIKQVGERKVKEPLRVLNVLRSTVAGETTQAVPALPGLGIGELPPAGYLPVAGSESVEGQVAALLGPYVDTRFCRCRPDYVPHAVEQAQHMDRIVITDPDRPQAVDILVPVPDTGAITPATTAYGWVAFVRRRQADCGPGPVDEVDVYTAPDDKDVIDRLAHGTIPPGCTQLATATYPPGTWAVPPPNAFAALREAVKGHNKITLFGLASSADRRSLAEVRAVLLLEPVDGVDLDPRTAVVPAGGREAIVAVLGTKEGGGEGGEGGGEGGEGGPEQVEQARSQEER